MSKLVLEHFSSYSLSRSLLEDRKQPENSRFFKPDGLWVSVKGKDDWESWCRAESYGDTSKQRRYEVILDDSANILYLRTATDLHKFTEKYRAEVQYVSSCIDWKKVALDYDGIIIIAPYIWECRLEEGMSWYYGWDCASGCIWKAKAIKKLTEQ